MIMTISLNLLISVSKMVFLMPDFSLQYVATFGADQRFALGNAGDCLVRNCEIWCNVVDYPFHSLPWRWGSTILLAI